MIDCPTGSQCTISATTQQNQAVQIAHTNTLKSLAELTQQRDFDHIFASIPINDGTNKEGFFEWVERLEAHRWSCSHQPQYNYTEDQ